jgi:GNAT superfamily N-acetyltransferase
MRSPDIIRELDFRQPRPLEEQAVRIIATTVFDIQSPDRLAAEQPYIMKDLSDPTYTSYAAVTTVGAVAMATAFYEPGTWKQRPITIVTYLGTHPEHRRQGYAGSLLAHIAAASINCRSEYIRLQATKKPELLQFYTELGFGGSDGYAMMADPHAVLRCYRKRLTAIRQAGTSPRMAKCPRQLEHEQPVIT